ncbi:group III truncated hemoglobin [Ornithobacterium rhinotracheale]|uniref:group III truncated hemoglobin n=1 Tax=Ornithobacterium rhinotracheale TaxID=28251 RepID=UPI001FF5F97B|nr:group III truncated hemoglobin [Ornithobacterium rhinotracheale]MCK0199679.1 group III truncated hemoglobin [Ornithobacterium rhinotracheale]UVD86294.1 group III truncated hemoglobin [Ornithobacterium rhinotracheale]
MNKPDLDTIELVRLMVDKFYTKVRKDELLAPIFEERIGDHWKEHLEKMYKFWQTILHDEHTYYGSPFPPHANMPVEQKHFDRWLELFNQNLNELSEGPLKEEASWRAQKMVQMFMYKIEYLRNQ